MSKGNTDLADVSRELASLDAIPNMEETAGLALAGGMAMQRTGNSYTTAITVQKPRQLHDVARRLVEEATLAGEDFYYGWGAGKDLIEGPSIELAVAAARCYGNCVTDFGPVQETDDAWIFTSVFIDLETGYTRTRQFRQSKKWQVHGRMDSERKDDVRFQIGQSKAERNVILKALPASLIARAMEAAKAGVKAKLQKYIDEKGLPAAIDLLLRALAKVGVVEAAILEKMGVAERKALDVEHLVRMRGDLNAIEKGQARFDDLYPRSATDKAADLLKGAQKPEQKPEKPEKPKKESKAAERPADESLRKRVADSASSVGCSQEYLNKMIADAGGTYATLTVGQAEEVLAGLAAMEPGQQE